MWREQVVDGDGNLPKIQAGVVVYPTANFRDTTGNGGEANEVETWGTIGIKDVARWWDSDIRSVYGTVSPFLLTCADYGSMFYNQDSYSDEPLQGASHELEGVNGVAFDGSARWISSAEYEYERKNNNVHPANGRVQKIFRKRISPW